MKTMDFYWKKKQVIRQEALQAGLKQLNTWPHKTFRSQPLSTIHPTTTLKLTMFMGTGATTQETI